MYGALSEVCILVLSWEWMLLRAGHQKQGKVQDVFHRCRSCASVSSLRLFHWIWTGVELLLGSDVVMLADREAFVQLG